MKRIPIEDLEHIFQNTQDLLESFRGKSIFLTGGTGFFGRWLLESFLFVNEKLKLNINITTISRNPDLFLEKYPFYNDHLDTINFIQGDILSYDFNTDKKFEYIIHAATAASDSLNKSNPLLMIDTITLGTRKVLDFAIKQNLEGFLYISSGAIYGKQPSDVSHITESNSFKININNSRAAYAEGKRVAELYCSTYHEKYNLPLKIARCFAFVGPYLPLDTHFAIGNFINNILHNEDILIKSDGSTIRSYMYPSDLIIWLWRILLKGEVNEAYNVGSDESISILKLAKKIKKMSKKDISIKIEGARVGFENVDIYCPSILKANTINASLKIKLDESISKTIKFYQKGI